VNVQTTPIAGNYGGALKNSRIALFAAILPSCMAMFLQCDYAEAAAKSTKSSVKTVATKQLSEDKAIDLVSNLPEVLSWRKLLKTTKGAGRAGYMATKDGATFTIQVFESRSDHNVTFAFYEVNARTRDIRKIEN
jgi:hypothetical protein